MTSHMSLRKSLCSSFGHLPLARTWQDTAWEGGTVIYTCHRCLLTIYVHSHEIQPGKWEWLRTTPMNPDEREFIIWDPVYVERTWCLPSARERCPKALVVELEDLHLDLRFDPKGKELTNPEPQVIKRVECNGAVLDIGYFSASHMPHEYLVTLVEGKWPRLEDLMLLCNEGLSPNEYHFGAQFGTNDAERRIIFVYVGQSIPG